jgi:hypothetical protein
MATVYKSLGQVSPTANTLTTLYTVPGAAATIVSSICVANRDSNDATFRISHAIGGAADAVAQYLAYDVPVPANRTYVFTLGLTLAASDLLRCYSSSGLLSFNAYGQERS